MTTISRTCSLTWPMHERLYRGHGALNKLRWRLASAQVVSYFVYDKLQKNLHYKHGIISIWLLGWLGCSSPSTEDVHVEAVRPNTGGRGGRSKKRRVREEEDEGSDGKDAKSNGLYPPFPYWNCLLVVWVVLPLTTSSHEIEKPDTQNRFLLWRSSSNHLQQSSSSSSSSTFALGKWRFNQAIFEVLGSKFYNKSSPSIWWLLELLRKTSLFVNYAVTTFWPTLVENWATFCSNIWSHWFNKSQVWTDDACLVF